jgi:hypothetical protein
MEERISIVFIILVGGKSYLHEGQNDQTKKTYKPFDFIN